MDFLFNKRLDNENEDNIDELIQLLFWKTKILFNFMIINNYTTLNFFLFNFPIKIIHYINNLFIDLSIGYYFCIKYECKDLLFKKAKELDHFDDVIFHCSDCHLIYLKQYNSIICHKCKEYYCDKCYDESFSRWQRIGEWYCNTCYNNLALWIESFKLKWSC